MPTIYQVLLAAVVACFASNDGATSAAADPGDATPRSAADAAARQQILNSPEWRRTEQYFQQWLSVQLLYNDQQVAKLKADLKAEIERMSPDELRGLQQHVAAMLQVLLSREGNESRDYVGRYLSVLATHKADELRGRLPDVIHMTPEELQDYLVAFQKNRAARQHESAAFDAARQRQVSAARQHQQQATEQFNTSWQQHQANMVRQTSDSIQRENQQSLDAARRASEADRQRGRFYPGFVPGYGWGGFRW